MIQVHREYSVFDIPVLYNVNAWNKKTKLKKKKTKNSVSLNWRNMFFLSWIR